MSVKTKHGTQGAKIHMNNWFSIRSRGSLRLDIPNEIAETSEETNVGFAASKCDKVATRFTSG